MRNEDFGFKGQETVVSSQNSGEKREYWNGGMMECWKGGRMEERRKAQGVRCIPEIMRSVLLKLKAGKLGDVPITNINLCQNVAASMHKGSYIANISSLLQPSLDLILCFRL